MELPMRVLKWGDGLAVRLPKALVEKMDLRAGDEINIVDVVERTLVVKKEDRRRAALERLAGATGRFLPITNSIGTRPTSGDRPFSIPIFSSMPPAGAARRIDRWPPV
jgi:antitoxin MazE